MKKLICLLFIVPVISLTEGCSSENGAISKTLPADKFQELLSSEKGILIDVRSQEEYEESHIDRAVNFNVNADSFKIQIDTLDKNMPYFLYCGSGKRSAKAMGIMERGGFKKLYNLEGGITEWRKNNLPVIKKEELRSQPI